MLLGDAAVGKTSLVRRFVVDAFDDKYIATIGTKVVKKDIAYRLPGRTIHLTLMIWDILGQRDYARVRNLGLRGSNGAIFVADLTKDESFSSIIEFWYPLVQEALGDVPMILIGNKSDLVPEKHNSLDLLSSISSELSSPSFVCSAKTGDNVENTFRSTGELILGKELEIGRDQSETDGFPSILQVVDYMITDFCEQYGDVQTGMETIERLFSEAKVNVTNPQKEQVLEALELLADIEKDRLGREISDVNKLRRWKLLEEAGKS